MLRLRCYFSNTKTTVTSAFFFSRQLSVAGEVADSRPTEREKESERVSSDKAHYHSMQFFFFSLVTVVLSVMPFPL